MTNPLVLVKMSDLSRPPLSAVFQPHHHRAGFFFYTGMLCFGFVGILCAGAGATVGGGAYAAAVACLSVAYAALCRTVRGAMTRGHDAADTAPPPRV